MSPIQALKGLFATILLAVPLILVLLSRMELTKVCSAAF
jgi:hypothetical protein